MDDYNLSSESINLTHLFRNIQTTYVGTVSDDFLSNRNGHIKEILHSMITDFKVWDENTKITKDFVRVDFSNMLNVIVRISANKEEIPDEYWDELFSYLLRFCMELYLSSANSVDFDISDVRNFAAINQDLFSRSAKLNIIYALHSLPITVLKGIINDSEFKNLEGFSNSLARAKSSMEKTATELYDQSKIMKNDYDEKVIFYRKEAAKSEKMWKEYISEKTDEVDKLKLALDSYKDAYNFVGLHDGFKNLHASKKIEKWWAFAALMILGMLVFAPFAYELAQISNGTHTFVGIYDLIPLVPIISISIVFLYYFRISLHNYNSIKTQILQIELRKTLCQFIQKYGEYSTKIKKEDPDSLSKFETVVFSNITTVNDAIPSTFDGIEHITKLIGTLKNK